MNAPAAAHTRPSSGLDFAGQVAVRCALAVVALLFAYDGLAMWIYYVRVARMPEIGYYDKWVNILFMLIGVVSLGRSRTPASRSFNFLSIALLAYALVMTALRGHDFGRPFMGQVYHWMIMFAGLNIGFAAAEAWPVIDRWLLPVAIGIVISSVLGYIFIELYRYGGGGAYMGYPTSQLLLPLAVLIVAKRWRWVAVVVVLMVLCGKRGPLVASLVMLAYMLTIQRGASIARALGAVVIAGTLLAGLLAAVQHAADARMFDRTTTVGRVVEKYDRTVDTEDLDRASSGRNIEVDLAMNYLSTPSEVLFGQGFGWEVQVEEEHHHYIHLAYLNYVISFGALGALALFGSIGWVLVRQMRRREVSRGMRIVVPFVGATLILTGSSAHINVTMLFWVALGVMLSRPEAVDAEEHAAEGLEPATA